MVLSFIKNKLSKNKSVEEPLGEQKVLSRNKVDKNENLVDIAIKDLNLVVSKSADFEVGPPESHWEERESIHLDRCASIDLNELQKIDLNDRNIELNPGEILFLKYIDGWKASNKSFPKYWTYDHDLIFQSVLYKFFKYGYVCFGDNSFKLANMTVNELKDILRHFNLKISGRKKELIDRLLESVTDKELGTFLKEDYFKITDKADRLIDENEHLFYFDDNKAFSFDIYEIDKIYRNSNFKNYYSLALSLLSNRIKESELDFRYGFIRNDFLNVASVYSHVKDYQKELIYMLMCLSVDMFSGALDYYAYDLRVKEIERLSKEKGLGQEITKLTSQNKLNKSEYDSRYSFAPMVVSRIFELQKMLKISNDTLKNYLWDIVKKLPITISINDFDNRFYEFLSSL